MGITPAWAGKSNSEKGGLKMVEDHPRVGGEKPLKCAERNSCTGSPPRGRGKVDLTQQEFADRRITPAWAGKSFSGTGKSGELQDHPRVGGEKRPAPAGPGPVKGSPPRGRGKVVKHLVQQLHGGITPAWAGKSLSQPPAGGRARDHPRVGGEKEFSQSWL